MSSLPLRKKPRIVLAGPGYKPGFIIEGVALEEDTRLIMSAGNEIKPPKESFSTLVREAEEQTLPALGSVLPRGDFPVLFLTVIYDLEKTPICREEWVRVALENLAALVEGMDIHTLAVPLFGAKYGIISPARCLELLNILYERPATTRLETLLIQLPAKIDQETVAHFAKATDAHLAF